MKHIIVKLSVGLFGFASIASAQTLFTEDFADASGFTTSTPFFADTFGDYFGIAGGVDDFGGAAVPPGLKAYTGFSGGFLTGMDLDGEGASLPITATWTGIDISGATSLEFSGKFAEFFDDPGDIDAAGDTLFVEAQIDGGGYSTILEFVPGNFSNDPFNGFFTNGTDVLGDAAQTFTTGIAGTGSLLDLRLTVSVNSGDEDFAVDDLTVTNVPEPSTYVALFGLLGLGFVLLRRRKA